MLRPRAALAALFTLSVLLAACGGAATSAPSTAPPSTPPTATASAPATDDASAAAFPVTIEAANGTVEIPARPRSIVSLSPTATEMLFAIGAGGQVVAVDEFSDHPSEAPTTALSGFEPNVEAVAGYDPDLVVIADDPGDLEASLTGLGIPVLVQPAAGDLDDSYAQIEELGRATGNLPQARDVASDLRDEIAKIVADVPRPDPPLTYYHELDDTLFSVTSDTFVGAVYEAFGLRNIADAAPGDAGAYPQLSPEFVIEADPDLIFLADTRCCGQSPATVRQRPGWQQIDAVRDDAVVPLDDDVASRWGPRIVDLVRTVADAVADAVDDRPDASATDTGA